jgi:hypothetical protein
MAGSTVSVGALTPIGRGHSKIQIDWLSDDSDGSCPDATIENGNLQGQHIESLEVIPGSGGAAPTGVFTVAAKNERGRALITDTDNPVDSIGFAVPTSEIAVDGSLTVTCSSIGNENEVSAIIVFYDGDHVH